jgi:hypothetical protein
MLTEILSTLDNEGPENKALAKRSLGTDRLLSSHLIWGEGHFLDNDRVNPELIVAKADGIEIRNKRLAVATQTARCLPNLSFNFP